MPMKRLKRKHGHCHSVLQTSRDLKEPLMASKDAIPNLHRLERGKRVCENAGKKNTVA